MSQENNIYPNFDPAIHTTDGTAGHSKGKWHSAGEEVVNADWAIAICGGEVPEREPNANLIALAQHAPHDCGDPECSGVINAQSLKTYEYLHTMLRELAPDFETIAQCIDFAGTNKRKVELYDKFQCAIKAFAEQGLLT